MANGLPEISVTLRFRYVVHSSEGNPFEAAWGTKAPPEYLIEDRFEALQQIFAKAGIKLIMHEGGIQPMYADEYFDIVWPGTDIQDAEWVPGQTWLNVYIVRSIDGKTNGLALTPWPGAGVYGCAVILATKTYLGIRKYEKFVDVWAQELGHVLGLSHTFDTDGRKLTADGQSLVDACMWPFEDDTEMLLTSIEDQAANPMSYKYDPSIDWTYPGELYSWTPNQVRRMRLTLMSRKSEWSYYAWDDLALAQGPHNGIVLPDFPALSLIAVMG